MARIRMTLPDNFRFSTIIPVRITDINYGGHTGNDSILSILHEARLQFLKSFGYNEINVAGAGLIMADVSIEFKSESFYGDQFSIQVTATNFERASFDIFYKIETQREGKTLSIANAKTGMVCFDYNTRRVTAIPQAAIEKFQS